MINFSKLFDCNLSHLTLWSYNPNPKVSLGSSAFARRYYRNRCNLSFPLGTKMVQFPRYSFIALIV